MGIIERQQAAAVEFGSEPLLVSWDGQGVGLAKGYIPLLANFTFEDKVAKGLRKRKAGGKPEPPVYFSALELVRDHQVLLLSGPSGSGKTSFAKHLAFRLATAGLIEAHPLARNEYGAVLDEHWQAVDLFPCYFTIDGPESLKTLVDNTLSRLVRSFRAEEQAPKSGLLIILDTIEKAGGKGPILLAEILTLVKDLENIKLLLLRETSGVKGWILSSDVVRHDLLPLLEVQRRQAVSILTGVAPAQVVAGIGAAAATPAYFALALEAKHFGDQAEELLDAWLAFVAAEEDVSDRVTAQAFDRLIGRSLLHDTLPSSVQPASLTLSSSNAVQRLLAARHLVNLPLETAISLFHSNPLESESILCSLLARLDTAGKSFDLVERLIRGSGIEAQLGALLVSDYIADSSKLREQISDQMLAIIEEGTLPVVQREKAGRVLSRLGDPRDLTALANVPAGDFILGSESHPNSQPAKTTTVGNFRICFYPAVNRDFSLFVQEAGRDWQSPDGFAPETQNMPATDLTWYDAMAYCAWLTGRWRLSGKISPDEHVRLPTEPEWERASRGDHQKLADNLIYPWGTEWQNDAANYEESGFNTRCAVGLFPKGRSPTAATIWRDKSGNGARRFGEKT
jgi:iron(II)-dependent oxidoreductase